MAGSRAGQVQYAERVNAAAGLLEDGIPTVETAVTLAGRFGVSRRQARRYVEDALSAGRRAVPEASVVFTVRLPASLAARVRRRATRSGVTISALVAQALTEFLSGGRGRDSRG